MPNTLASTANRKRTAKPKFSEAEYKRLLAEIMPRPISNATENEAAIELVERLDEGTPEQQAIGELLTVLIEDFEEKHYPLLQGEPRDHLRDLMKERGHTQSEVAKGVGAARPAISDILSGRRQISKGLAKKLATLYRVPVDLFL